MSTWETNKNFTDDLEGGNIWSARIGLRYRAVAEERTEGLVWFWIGRHDRNKEILKT